MKKDRNSFFSEYGFNSVSANYPNMNNPYMAPNMMPNPNQAVSANSNFYAGPIPNQENTAMNNNMYSEIDSRLSKIERRLTRLENRVTHLEGDNSYDDNNYSSNNMYMV